MLTEAVAVFLRPFFETTLGLWASLAFLGKDIRRLWSQVLVCGILHSGFCLLSYYIFGIELNLLRLLFNTIMAMIIIKIVFRYTWWNSTKTFIIVWLFLFAATVTGTLVNMYFFHVLPAEEIKSVSIIFELYLPIYIITVICAYGLRKISASIHYFFTRIKEECFSSFRYILGAVLLQLFIIALIMSQTVVDNNFSEHPLKNTLIMMGTVLHLFLNFFIIFRAFHVIEEKVITTTQNAMSDNIMSLINSVRSQRHDFINHIQIINSLFHSKNDEDLSKYLAQLNADVSVYNDILKIDEPIIGALLNAKMTQAGLKGINFNVDNNTKLSLLKTKTLEITRILGNLIDNAIEAAEQSLLPDKWVKVTIDDKGPLLSFSVTNSGIPPAGIAEKVFEPGFTTKGDNHCGLGLYICRQLAEKLHGSIDYDFDSGLETRVSLVIPK